MRSASASSSAIGLPDPGRRAACRAQAVRRPAALRRRASVSMRASVCRRIAVAKSAPATASAMTADAARRGRAWSESWPHRVRHQRRFAFTGAGLEQLVAELLDRHERVGEQRQLLAQPPHVDVDRARAAGVAVAPDVGQQHVARQHAAAVQQEIFEQQELLRRQRHVAGRSTRRCGARGRRRSARRSWSRPSGAVTAARAAQQRAHARHELVGAERLGEVVVGAELEADDALRLLGARGEHDDGDRGGLLVARAPRGRFRGRRPAAASDRARADPAAARQPLSSASRPDETTSGRKAGSSRDSARRVRAMSGSSSTTRMRVGMGLHSTGNTPMTSVEDTCTEKAKETHPRRMASPLLW